MATFHRTNFLSAHWFSDYIIFSPLSSDFALFIWPISRAFLPLALLASPGIGCPLHPRSLRTRSLGIGTPAPSTRRPLIFAHSLIINRERKKGMLGLLSSCWAVFTSGTARWRSGIGVPFWGAKVPPRDKVAEGEENEKRKEKRKKRDDDEEEEEEREEEEKEERERRERRKGKAGEWAENGGWPTATPRHNGRNAANGTPAAAPVIIRIERPTTPMERVGSEREKGRRGRRRSNAQEEEEQREGEQDQQRRQQMVGMEQHQQQQNKPLSLSVADVRPRDTSLMSATQQHRPCSSLVAGEQFGPGKPCARIRLCVQYSQQKKLLIITLNELVQTLGDDGDDLWLSDNVRGDKPALQVRLALLSECATGGKVPKFQSKFVPMDPLIPIQLSQTFAFDLSADQLAESVVRLRLYRKSRQKRVPTCVAVAFLRNYLVDVEAKKAQNHFLQFRRVLDPSPATGSAKGSMSLFPSLLSLYHNFGSHPPPPQPPPSKPSPSPPPLAPSACSSSLNPPSPLARASVIAASGRQQNSPSASRRGSTVDESGRFCALPQADGQNPEVLVSLCFFDDQSRLSVCVDKAALRKEGQREDGREQDVLIRIAAVCPEGVELSKHKSAPVKAAPDVSFNTQAVFSLSRSQLDSTHVLVQLFALNSGPLLFRRGRAARRLIGSLALGEDQCSSPDAQQHWREMLQGMGTTVDKWHVLGTE